MKNLLEKLYSTNELSREELLFVLENLDEDAKELLFSYALETKQKHYGNKIYLRGLIEFSNYCKQNCLYCGIRRENKNVDRYRLSFEDIMNCCEEGYELGYRTFVLQSGEDPYYTDDLICNIVSEIKSKYPDVVITLSIGEKDVLSYQRFFDAGVSRYLLRHETASDNLYQRLHNGMELKNRLSCLQNLKEIGFQTGAGFMVGLPDQTNEDLVNDLIFLKTLNPHMVGIGPFIPHDETPLAGATGGTVEKTLVMVALTRLLLPKALMPATTALGSMDHKGREKAMKAGANVVMPNLSPVSVRAKYEIYQGKICTGDESAHCRACIERRIHSAGFEVDMSKGDYIN